MFLLNIWYAFQLILHTGGIRLKASANGQLPSYWIISIIMMVYFHYKTRLSAKSCHKGSTHLGRLQFLKKHTFLWSLFLLTKVEYMTLCVASVVWFGCNAHTDRDILGRLFRKFQAWKTSWHENFMHEMNLIFMHEDEVFMQ